MIALLWVAILATIRALYRAGWRPGALLVPSLARVRFAAYLNYGSWVLD